jgi:methyl-accepting chemotaxis protein
LLRLHRPEQFGDDLSSWRESIVEANRGRRLVKGLEVSRSGPGLKVVLPLVVDGVSQGSVEAASEMHEVLDEISGSLGAAYAISVYQDVWDKARCEDLLEAVVVRENRVFFHLSEAWLEEALRGLERLGEGRIQRLGDRTLGTTRWVIEDYAGTAVGEVILFEDVEARVAQLRRSIFQASFLIGLLALGLIVIAYSALGYGLLRPLSRAVRLAETVADGDYTARVEVQGENELAMLGDSLNRMSERLEAAVEGLKAEAQAASEARAREEEEKGRAAEQRDDLARSTRLLLQDMSRFQGGDLTVTVPVSREDEIGRLFAGFNSAVGNMRSMVQELAEVAATLSASMVQVSGSTGEMAEGATEQRSRTGEILAGIGRVTRFLGETAELAERARERSLSASEAATEGARQVEASGESIVRIVQAFELVASRIRSLVERMREVEGVVGVIDEIAQKTTLLALNASIQAAHAGEEGRSFAVVATEIRKLSERTTASTGVISRRIEEIRQGVEETAESVVTARATIESGETPSQDLGRSLRGILASSQEVARTIREVAEACQAQVEQMVSLSEGTEGVARVTGLFAASSSEIAAASDEVRGLAARLTTMIQRFRLD